jgi:hypothetical protein
MMDWINPLYAWGGLTAVIVAGCVAVAIYFPLFRKQAIAVALGVVGIMAIYRKGAKDASGRKQKEWDDAERKSIARGNKARSDAERDVNSGRVRDKFDRDDL